MPMPSNSIPVVTKGNTDAPGIEPRPFFLETTCLPLHHTHLVFFHTEGTQRLYDTGWVILHQAYLPLSHPSIPVSSCFVMDSASFGPSVLVLVAKMTSYGTSTSDIFDKSH